VVRLCVLCTAAGASAQAEVLWLMAAKEKWLAGWRHQWPWGGERAGQEGGGGGRAAAGWQVMEIVMIRV